MAFESFNTYVKIEANVLTMVVDQENVLIVSQLFFKITSNRKVHEKECCELNEEQFK